jgi:hypothetical protein
MRTIYGLLVISLLLFLGGIAFIVLAARDAGKAPAAAPVATIKQMMQGIVTPASAAIYNAVSTTITEKGTEEIFPRNDREWEIVGSHALALVEASNLMKVNGRAKDSTDWMRLSDTMATAAMQSYRATEKKDVDALLASGEALNNSCDSCHRRYEAPVE